MAVAYEDVERREIAMEQLSAMQLAEHFEHAGNLAARVRLAPALVVAMEVRAQIAVWRVLEHEAVEHTVPAAIAHQRKHVVDLNRARMLAQLWAEVGLTQPAVDVRTGLDAHRLGHRRRAPEPPGQID